MYKINLSLLKNYQQVPDIFFKPVKVAKDKVYFIKLIENNNTQQWIEGIYCYYIQDDKLIRLDVGFHSKSPYKYKIFFPYDDDDLLVFENMNYLFFSIISDHYEIDEKANIIIYALDLNTHEQFELFSIKYDPKEFTYIGFTPLSDSYILIELVNEFNPDIKDLDRIFILNVYNNELIEIFDIILKYSVGTIKLSSNNRNIFLEEVYMSEDDEVAILSSDTYILDDEELEKTKLDPFKNSIKGGYFEEFKVKCKKSRKFSNLKDFDKIKENGILRVIGNTKDFIYYKKQKLQNQLSFSKDFRDRIMIGKQELFSINKNTLEIKKISNLEINSIFCCEDDNLYKIIEEKHEIKIINIKTGITEYTHIKENLNEFFVDFSNQRYLIIDTGDDTISKMKLFDLKNNNLEMESKNIFIFSDIIFYEE